MDSLKHREEIMQRLRAAAKVQQEANDKAEAEQVAQRQAHDQAVRQRETEFLEAQMGLVQQTDTRELIMERIRKMREEKPQEPRYIGRNAALQEQFEREQEAGRAAVAKHEAEQENSLKLQAKVEEDDRKRLGTMEPVYRPNHDQSVQAPAIGATLGKPSGAPKQLK